jgi:hypothetical protein
MQFTEYALKARQSELRMKKLLLTSSVAMMALDGAAETVIHAIDGVSNQHRKEHGIVMKRPQGGSLEGF